MRIAIIGRSELMYDTALAAIEAGHELALLVTAKEAPEYRKSAKDFEKLAVDQRALFINSAKINAPENMALLRNLGPMDIALSVNYSGIIATEVIECFRLGVLNAHGGDLPRYRGNACMAWAIIRGESEVGLCIHKMIGGELDSGNIIVRKHMGMTINTRVGETYEWMHAEIPGMMMAAVDLLRDNPDAVLEVQSKRPEAALRTYPRLPEDGKIDWTLANEPILRLINASSEPFAGAFCEFENEKMIIWRARIYRDDEQYLAMAGQVCFVNPDNGEVIVATGHGKLAVEEVTFKGVREKPGKFIHSIRKRLK